MNLAELFPDEDYRFQMRFQRARPAEFFQPTAAHDELTGQRQHWLKSTPQLYAKLLPEGIPLLEETIQSAHEWQSFSQIDESLMSPDRPAWKRCLDLGAKWEPDFLLLKSNGGGPLHLLGGCVCFPSSWSLSEKIGQPIETIHGVVPGLNPELGNQIHAFLSKLKPGVAWLRQNWGLSRSPELNQHPERKLPRLDASVKLEEVFLRVEHQALVALPKTNGILFGIRIAIHPLSELKNDSLAKSRLIRALKSMPEEMAAYKNLAAARATIIALLKSPAA